MKRIQNVDLATSGDNILLSRYELWESTLNAVWGNIMSKLQVCLKFQLFSEFWTIEIHINHLSANLRISQY